MQTTKIDKQYTETHEWFFLQGKIATIGISIKAKNELGEVVYVELPKVGSCIKKGGVLLVLESTKAAADIYAPLSGKVVAINESLQEHIEKLNLSPEGEGWLVQLEIDDRCE